jgi:hypothetical protein
MGYRKISETWRQAEAPIGDGTAVAGGGLAMLGKTAPTAAKVAKVAKVLASKDVVLEQNNQEVVNFSRFSNFSCHPHQFPREAKAPLTKVPTGSEIHPQELSGDSSSPMTTATSDGCASPVADPEDDPLATASTPAKVAKVAKVARTDDVTTSGKFMDAQGNPTDDPEQGYYGRKSRENAAVSTKANGGDDGFPWEPGDVENLCHRYAKDRAQCGEEAADFGLKLCKAKSEFRRIKQMAKAPPDRRPALGPPGDSLDDIK